ATEVPAMKPVVNPASPLPRPHSVRFRSLPGAAEPARSLLSPALVAYHAPRQPASAQYADLLAALVEGARGKAGNSQVLLFITPRAEVGCTTTLLNVAITAARQDRRTVVVDANLRRPGVAACLGMEPAPGLTDVLAGDCALAAATRPTAQDRL